MNLTPRFPLRVSASGRYLEDADGVPFLYQADTLWLLSRRPLEDVDVLFALRKSEGFTAIQLHLTGFLGTKNVEGRLPFGEAHDLADPDERYFSHMDALFNCAQRHGLLLAVAPLWVGCCREGWAGKGEDGALRPMNIARESGCEAFGRWLGTRYESFDNLLWILGGDNDPWSVDAVALTHALVAGLKQSAPEQLLTYHASSAHSSTDVFPDAPWLDISMVYTYFRGFNKAWNKVQPDVSEVCLLEHRKQPVKPYFLGESTYEGEHDAWGSAHQIRKQAYAALLSGAFGHAYGSTNWRCDDNGQVATLPGVTSLQHLTALFSRYPWHTLLPDFSHPQLANNSVSAASTPDEALSILYLPTPRPVSVVGSWSRAAWYDPTTGTEHEIKPEATLLPHGTNAAGEPDWILLLK